MASYTGSSRDATRIQVLEKERKLRLAEIERQKEKIARGSSSNATKASLLDSKFASHTDSVEDLLKQDTIGLVTFEDFKNRREYLEKSAATERAKIQDALRDQQTKEQRLRLKKANLNKLSFAGKEDEEEEEEDAKGEENILEKEDNRDNNAREPVSDTKSKNSQNNLADENKTNKDKNESEAELPYKRQKLGKNPYIDTSFLPDRDRELALHAERERLKQEFLNEQERIKSEIVQITYSYWDGSGHRRTISCKKGTTIGKFLAMVQQEFHELRNVSPEYLMFIKEDLIIPHHYSFYDFIVTKARGKSGPLFNFDVHEDVRLFADATKEKEDAHAAKVVERRWYERNNHIFPASRWEVYDPTKKYDKYTIHGGEVN